MSLNKHSLLLIFFNVKMNEFKGVSNIDDDGDEYPKKNNSIRKDFCLNVADVTNTITTPTTMTKTPRTEKNLFRCQIQ
ncbi:hypothetical protein DERP_007570 [Dermatophagoides pteronyssinus]|uniref:Uncharacterized protein n=1 Tax=Dermatophagoides pteronyssinus TaxID=6956 RepID=A0ABQ8JK44_DERPT|nr:hypothetical protein DERP_007570 [Dermatophagoides pteronyssinus]